MTPVCPRLGVSRETGLSVLKLGESWENQAPVSAWLETSRFSSPWLASESVEAPESRWPDQALALPWPKRWFTQALTPSPGLFLSRCHEVRQEDIGVAVPGLPLPLEVESRRYVQYPIHSRPTRDQTPAQEAPE